MDIVSYGTSTNGQVAATHAVWQVLATNKREGNKGGRVISKCVLGEEDMANPAGFPSPLPSLSLSPSPQLLPRSLVPDRLSLGLGSTTAARMQETTIIRGSPWAWERSARMR